MFAGREGRGGQTRILGLRSNIPADGLILRLFLMCSSICQQWHMEPSFGELVTTPGVRCNIPSDGGILPPLLDGLLHLSSNGTN